MTRSIVDMWIKELRDHSRASRASGYAQAPEHTWSLGQRRDTQPFPPPFPESEPTRKTARMFRALGRDAGIRGLPVTLTERQYAYMVLRDECHYCGCRLRGGGSNVDRKDPNDGYTPMNSVACCRDCNKAKLSHNYETWLAIAHAFVEKHGRGKMWPSEDARDAAANKLRAQRGREARSVAYGVRALALWAMRACEPEQKQKYRAAYRAAYQRKKSPETAPKPPPRIPLERFAALVREKKPDPTPTRGGFVWRGVWRDDRWPR